MSTPMLALLVCTIVCVSLLPWGNATVRTLLRLGIGKNIRDDEPETHQKKAGTATMGGIYFLAGITAATMLLLIAGMRTMLAPWVAMLGYGLLGAYDDWIGLRAGGGEGWKVAPKFATQWGLAIGLSLVAYALVPRHGVRIPVTGRWTPLGWWVVPLLAYCIVAMSNAVNVTDGLDGLAGGAAAVAFSCYGLLAVLDGDSGLALFCAATLGGLLAFLCFNAHPAQMFMGDLGSQALGAGLAVVAVQSGHVLLLPIIAGVFVIEALSVMIQVTYFKYTRKKTGTGRRVLRMSPLHYHLELGGWSEVQIVTRAWVLAALSGAVGVALGLGGGGLG